jgi:hypothetical protein
MHKACQLYVDFFYLKTLYFQRFQPAGFLINPANKIKAKHFAVKYAKYFAF